MTLSLHSFQQGSIGAQGRQDAPRPRRGLTCSFNAPSSPSPLSSSPPRLLVWLSLKERPLKAPHATSAAIVAQACRARGDTASTAPTPPAPVREVRAASPTTAAWTSATDSSARPSAPVTQTATPTAACRFLAGVIPSVPTLQLAVDTVTNGAGGAFSEHQAHLNSVCSRNSVARRGHSFAAYKSRAFRSGEPDCRTAPFTATVLQSPEGSGRLASGVVDLRESRSPWKHKYWSVLTWREAWIRCRIERSEQRSSSLNSRRPGGWGSSIRSATMPAPHSGGRSMSHRWPPRSCPAS